MAKASGGTRGSNPRSMYGSGNTSVDTGMTPAQFQRYVDEVANNELPNGWSELEPERRELALMEAGFSGWADDGAETIVFEESKESILASARDAIINDFLFGERANNDTYITVAYKDGTIKQIGALGSEIELVRPLSNNQNSSTQSRIAMQSLRTKDIAFVTHNDAWRDTAWIAKGSEAQFIRYTGYEKWTRGRGTKRRSYIQDDWI